jgi:hypothetical protein
VEKGYKYSIQSSVFKPIHITTITKTIMKKNINEQWVLQNMVSSMFEDSVGNLKSESLEKINYFGDRVELVYKDGQSLIFSVEKINNN